MEKIYDSIYSFIDKNIDYTKGVAKHIYENPEIGFKEFKTSEYAAKQFENLLIDYVKFGGITGIKATIDSGKEGMNIAVIGELDALLCSSHADADKKTGAAHVCGHNVMIADVLTVAKVFKELNLMDGLCGKIHFLAVPAEEYIDMDYRLKLVSDGVIRYPTGKAELIHRGVFDDVDCCIMLHLMPGNKTVGIETGGNGFVAKKIKYIGKATHAASTPENGINALYAANLGLSAVNAIRETFKESSCVRVHPVIAKGGDAMNVIPAEVELETLVRANNIYDVAIVNEKVDRAMVGAAISMGAKVQIVDTPGMLPLYTSKALMDLAMNTATKLVGEDEVSIYPPSKGSSDLGDVSTLMPAIEICIECITGGLHTSEYSISDEHKAYNVGTKMLTIMAYELLSNNAVLARKLVDDYKPYFEDKNSYFEFMDSCFASKLYPKRDCMK